MPTIDVTATEIRVRLTAGERVAALHLSRDGVIRVPRSAVADAAVVPDGVAATRGLRAPGLALPGVRKIGTWRSRAGRQFVSVRGGEPALRLTLAGHRYAELLLGVADPAGWARTLQPATPATAPTSTAAGSVDRG